MSEYDYLEDNSLLRLSEEELDKFDKSIELFIQNPEDTKNIWLLTDNIIELEDSLKDIKSSYYENFDKSILKSKNLLESAYVVCSDKTVKALIGEAITKVKECLDRLGIKEPEYEKYKEKPYSKYEDKYPYKSKEEKLAREILDRNFAPLGQDWKDIATDIKDTHDNIKKIPEIEQFDPKITQYVLDGIKRLQERQNEYETKKKELALAELSKIELSKEEDSLTLFRSKLLDRCISQMIEDGK